LKSGIQERVVTNKRDCEMTKEKKPDPEKSVSHRFLFDLTLRNKNKVFIK
jgi:hypothetical protein